MTEERFIGGWTRSSLAARTAAERHAIWKRARMLHTADGNQLAREIERLGLPYEEPEHLAQDDPMRLAMAELVGADQVRLKAAGIIHPSKVRYAYSNVPDINLYSGDGIPVGPFSAEATR